MPYAAIQAIEYHLPDRVETNADIQAEYPDWPIARIEEKSGILQRHIAAPGECASDLAVCAAQKLFRNSACRPAEIDFLLLCTQTPDYFLPTTACVLQHRLGVPTSAGALDFNLGCSGYVYGLGMARALVESGQAANVLLLTADTYSRFISPADKSVRTIFGDGAAATWVRASEIEAEPGRIGPCVWGTDGSGARHLMVPAGAMRDPGGSAEILPAESGNARSQRHLFMDGTEIFQFTLQRVPEVIRALLERARLTLAEIDFFVFHQANVFLLEHLRRKLGIPAEKFTVCLDDCGNTVSSSIPIALKRSMADVLPKRGDRVMLIGFGVGYSWAAAIVTW